VQVSVTESVPIKPFETAQVFFTELGPLPLEQFPGATQIAFVEGMKVVREKPDVVVASLVKHLRIAPDVAHGAYRSFVNVWEEVPYVRVESVQAILDFLPKEQVKDISAGKYVDNSLMKELETSGFIKNLYRK